MTATLSPRDTLLQPDLRRSLAAFVRRRVPAGEVEDIAQTVLCDALASPSIPQDPHAVPRFVTGIAKHKVVDFHRRERWVARGEEVPELACDPEPVDDRALLLRVVESATQSPRERETFEWLLREHDGEQLASIAVEAGVAPATVRQRVSRMRRALRARWSHLLALFLVAATSGSAIAEHVRSSDRSDPASAGIMADPTGDRASQMIALSQGRWRVDSFVADATLQTAERSALSIDAKSAHVRIVGDRIEIKTTTRTIARAMILTPRAGSNGTFDVAFHGGARIQHGIAWLENGDLRLTIEGHSVRLARE